MTNLEINRIRIDRRIRKQLVNIDSLAESIRQVGLINPITLDSNYRLIAGERRLQAVKSLGWTEIPATIATNLTDALAAIKAERDENTQREPLLPEEIHEAAKLLREIEKEAARKRQAQAVSNRHAKARGDSSGKLPELEVGDSRDKIADGYGISGKTLDYIDKVFTEGSEELKKAVNSSKVAVSTAATLAELPAEEQTEIVARGEKEIIAKAKEIQQQKTAARRAERLQKLSVISQGNSDLDTAIQYPVIYADPPWRYEHASSTSREIENQYPTMALEEICALPVNKLATQDAILFLWATSPKLQEAFQVIEAWGFTYRTNAVWDKQKIGMGYYFRQQHELLLVATRGNIPAPDPANRPPSLIAIPRDAKHSAKPAPFAELIEAMYPSLPKVELFCRSPRANWAAWGNESDREAAA